jgi:hypothetical protein
MRWLSNTARRGLLIVLLNLVISPPSSAQEVYMSFYYQGEPSGQFTNTTPKAGFCSQWPAYCASVDTVDLPIEYTKTSVAQATDKRDQFFLTVPQWYGVTVIDPDSKQSYTVSVEILSVSQRVHGKAQENPVNTRTVLGGCSYNKSFTNGDQWSSYLWNVTDASQQQGCYASNPQAKPGDIVTSQVSDMAIGYRVHAGPLGMKPGRYQGTTMINIGRGQEFDFGNGVSGLSANTVTLRMELDVRPPLRVDFPSGTEHVVLEPPGGWSSWLSHGRPPQRLFRDLQFHVTAMGSFTAYKSCQYPVGEGCGIRNEANHQVPVSVAVTLPAEILENRQQLVRKRELPTGRGAAPVLTAMTSVAYRRGQLHLEVAREHAQEMLKYPGSTYRGDLTVIFDAQF